MTMKLKIALFCALTATIALPALAQKAVEAPGGKFAKEADQMFRASFRADNPKYWMTRLEQDETMKTCGQYRDNPPRKMGEQIEKANKASIRYPVDGKLIGDWKEGEKLAAVGTGGHIGFIQPDPAGRVRGGNCYACHELAKKEVAYGTIGPSLHHFSKLRGTSDEDRQVRLRQDLQLERLLGVHQHAAFWLAQLADAGADHPSRCLPG
jgi:sulfur-oxidizing protein SoxX